MKKSLYPCWIRYSLLLACLMPGALAAQELASAYELKESGTFVSGTEKSLKQVLREIETKHYIFFTYRDAALEDKLVRVKHDQWLPENASSQQVEAMVADILATQRLKYKKIDNIFVVFSATDRLDIQKLKQPDPPAKDSNTEINQPTFLLARLKTSRQFLVAPAVVINGKVTDENNAPLPGVNVLVKGTTNGTTTDASGGFNLNVPDQNAVLVFSYIGYTSEEVAVGSQATINVQLLPDIQSLSEVVVVGYGTQKRTSVTGAIASVSSKEISALPVVNVSQALQGRAPGVTVVNNGSPGAAPIIRIRGIGTVNNADPLYVIDGFPTGDLNSFDTKDIESVEVLKDASAAAIYGSRGANGVILITTKRGTDKKFSVNIDSYAGVEQAWRTLDLLNRDQYVAYARDLEGNAAVAEGKDPNSRIPERIKTGLNQPVYPGATQTFGQTDTDWQDEMFRNAVIQQHRIALMGGNNVSRFYASGGYFNQEGIMRGTGYERGSFRINSDHNISKRFTFGQTLYLGYDDQKAEQNAGGRTQVQHMIRSQPYLPVYNPENLGGFAGAQGLDGSDPENPVRIATLDKQNIQRFKLLGMGYLEASIVNGLTFRLQGGIDYVSSTDRIHLPSFNTGAGGFAARNRAEIRESRYTSASPIFTGQFTFNRMFGKHALNAVVAAERQTSIYTSNSGGGYNSQSNDIKVPQENTNFTGSRTEYAIISLIGRINYTFNDRYLLGASFRRDGSSRFAPGNKWGNFPAVSAGWRIGQEEFLRNSGLISELKIRGSFGRVGNNNIGDYAYQATLSGNQYYEFDRATATQTVGYTVRKLANPDLQWEVTEMANVGLDVGLFSNQLTFTAEFFNNENTNMILERPIPFSLGYDQRPSANVGSVRNRGIELQLGYNKTEGDFQWNASANMSIIRNKVLALGDSGATFTGGDWYGDNLTQTEVGQPIGYFRGYQVEGIFQSQSEINAADEADGDAATKYQDKAAPGDIRFRDVNGDGVITDQDKVKIGHFLPDFTFGINLSANWRNFDATMFIQGVQGNEIYSVTKYELEGMSRLFNSGTAVLNRWTQEGQNTEVPRAISGDPNRNGRSSDRFIEDGSYLRIKNLTIGYSLPEVFLQSATNGYLSRIRIYLSSQNLLTLTGYDSGYDPEVGSRFGASLTNGIDYGQYPQARSLLVGLQVGF